MNDQSADKITAHSLKWEGRTRETNNEIKVQIISCFFFKALCQLLIADKYRGDENVPRKTHLFLFCAALMGLLVPCSTCGTP